MDLITTASSAFRRRRTLGLLLVVLLVIGAAYVARTPSQAGAREVDKSWDGYDYINQLRQQRGVPALPMGQGVQEVAYQWANFLADGGGYRHRNDGAEWNNAKAGACPNGGRATWFSEAISGMYQPNDSGRGHVNNFMTSQPHADILMAQGQYMGVGVVTNGYQSYMVVHVVRCSAGQTVANRPPRQPTTPPPTTRGTMPTTRGTMPTTRPPVTTAPPAAQPAIAFVGISARGGVLGGARSGQNFYSLPARGMTAAHVGLEVKGNAPVVVTVVLRNGGIARQVATWTLGPGTYYKAAMLGTTGANGSNVEFHVNPGFSTGLLGQDGLHVSAGGAVALT